MQIKYLILEEACKASKRTLYVSCSTKKIIIQNTFVFILVKLNLINKVEYSLCRFYLERKLDKY
jgi:hypothetical protein